MKNLDHLSIKQLYDKQLSVWSDFRQRVEQLDQIVWKTFDFGSFRIMAQFNPARAVSSGAKLDKKSIADRKCFLCEENRPSIQEGLRLNDRFSILVNPFPILHEHFTIPLDDHREQEIKPYIGDLLDFTQMMPQHTLLYNGPKCGASAPDHIHFQAVRRGQIPFESEYKLLKKREVKRNGGAVAEEMLDFGRKCIHIVSSLKEEVVSLFNDLYVELQTGEDEPLWNIFSFYEDEAWHLFLFLRKTHRPSQFFSEGEDYMMISPGAIDIAGVFVLPRWEDFEKIDKGIIEDVLRQVSA